MDWKFVVAMVLFSIWLNYDITHNHDNLSAHILTAMFLAMTGNAWAANKLAEVRQAMINLLESAPDEKNKAP